MKILSSTKINNSFLQVLTGALMSLSVSLISILFFALIIRFFNLPDSIIMPTNQIIKIVSIFIGVYTIISKDKSQGLKKGLFIGLVYSILAYFIFAILSQDFTIQVTLFLDVLFSSIIGAICGIIVVNIKK